MTPKRTSKPYNLRTERHTTKEERRVPPEVRDDWSEWVLPSELADKLDVYCSVRNTAPSVKKTAHLKDYPSKSYAPKRSSLDGRFNRFTQAGSTSSFNRNNKLKTDEKSERPPISCYGCGKLVLRKPDVQIVNQ
ncbi:hypothetical protein TNIN_179031 [Trichonephila inaurata madagascariensis]|uniref:Uncharacterized protein n=1 Tax=Trichonephila inaurata madagascariensis TaxID=2747483 RepID=A0A8X6XTU4_9ARAC|nr:hypothetical protein TNIN_179031 [Trichonephila inaurata madagascariensis]